MHIFGYIFFLSSWYIKACTYIKVNHDLPTSSSNLIDYTTKTLCNFEPKSVYVVFEQCTFFGFSQKILTDLNNCGISYTVIRKQYWQRTQLIADDGVLMYLLIIIQNASQTLDLHLLKKEAADKYRSYIMVFIEDAKFINQSWLISSFKKLWDKWILNVVIIFYKNNTIEIWGYTPFTKPFLIRYKATLETVSRKDLFPELIPDLNGERLKICIFSDQVRAIFKPNGEIIGADGYMVHLLVNKLNASRSIVSSTPNADYGYIYDNGTIDGCLKLVANNEADFALNTRFLLKDMFGKRIENSVVYDRDDLCVVVPKSGERNSFYNIFRSFESCVWISIFGTFIFAFVVLKRLVPSKYRLLLKLFGSIIEIPFGKLPNVRLFNWLLIFWLYFCLLITNAFKGNLTSNLIFRESLPDLNTLAELSRSPYKILIYERHQKYISQYVIPSFHQLRLLKKKMIPVSENYFQEKISENNRNFAYMEKAHIIHYIVNNKKHYSNGKPIYHVMKSCPFPFESVYIVPYGSPYLGYLNKIVRVAQESGFITHWSRLMDAEARIRGISVIKHKSTKEEPAVLIIEDLKTAFAMLALGLVGSCICFIYEVLYFHL